MNKPLKDPMIELLIDALDKGIELLRIAYEQDVVEKVTVLRAFANVAVCANHLATRTDQSLRKVLDQVLELITEEPSDA